MKIPRQIILFILLLIILTALSIIIGTSLYYQNFKLTTPSVADENAKISANQATEMPVFVGLYGSDIKEIQWNSNDYELRAYQYFTEIENTVDPASEFILVSEKSDSIGMTHVKFQQHVQDVPVYGAEMVFHFRQNGSLSSVNGAYLRNLSTVVTTPQISKDEVFGYSKKVSQASETGFTNEHLIIYSEAFFSRKPDVTRLVWEFSSTSSGINPTYTYRVDANTGELVKRISNFIN